MNTKTFAMLITLILPISAWAIDVFEDMYKHMRYLAERDKILSQNIQNSDTPGYLPHDLAKRSSTQDNVAMIKTNSMHMDANDSDGFNITAAKVDELKPNGNGVNIDRELFKKGENAVQLNEAVSLYNKSKNLLNTAITGVSK